ncbi:MAG TPA: YitT family protein [Clostridiales bacterium]|nr:YitT family protein [Clostridiales bacterium]
MKIQHQIILNKNTLFDLSTIFVGSFLWVVAINALLVPNGLLSSGFTGIAILINNFWPAIPLSVGVYALNIPALLWALKELNKRFLFYTVFAVTVQSLFIQLLENIPTYNGDPMLAAIFAGVLGGIGGGAVIRRSGSSGGTDIIGVIIKKKWGYSIGTVGFIFNIFVLTAGAFLYGLEIAMYTVIFIGISSVATDKAIQGISKRYTAMIITRYPDQMKTAIFDRLHRGVTFLHGKGAFSGDQKDIIYCAINQYELAMLKDLLYTIDPDAFMTITETTEIYGHFRNTFKETTMLTAAEMENNALNDVLGAYTAAVDKKRPFVEIIDKDREVVEIVEEENIEEDQ